MNPKDQSNCLTPAEQQEWQEVGKALAEPVVEVFPDYTQEQLKRFVLDYCDGRLYCDHQCDPSILGMVFLPLALGAFGPQGPDEEKGTEGDAAWHAMQNLPPDPGDEPKSTPPPPEPPSPEHQLTLDALRTTHEALLEEHRVALLGHQEQEDRLAERKAKWERAKAIHEAARRGFTMTRLQHLGVIYEEISKAGPRSINGQPIFWSLRVINRSDWKRAHAAITRELSRRENMEI